MSVSRDPTRNLPIYLPRRVGRYEEVPRVSTTAFFTSERTDGGVGASKLLLFLMDALPACPRVHVGDVGGGGGAYLPNTAWAWLLFAAILCTTSHTCMY